MSRPSPLFALTATALFCSHLGVQSSNDIHLSAGPEDVAAPNPGRLLVQGVVTAVAFLAAAYTGVGFSITDGPFFSPVWPASALALAALLLWGPWMLPAIYLGSVANHAGWSFNSLTMWVAPLGPVCEAWAAAWILTRMLGPKPRLTDLRGCIAFLVAAPWLPALFIALYETALNAMDQSGGIINAALELAVYVMANGCAIALLVPAFMVWKTKPEPSWWRGMALFAPLSAVSAAAVFAFHPGITPAVLFPVLLAAGAVLGLQGAAPLVALVSVIAAAGTAMTFPADTTAQARLAEYVSMYATLGLLAASVLPVAAIIDGYRSRTRRIAHASRASGLVLWSWDRDEGLIMDRSTGSSLRARKTSSAIDPRKLFDPAQDQGCLETETEGRQTISWWTITGRDRRGRPRAAAGMFMDSSDRLSLERTRRRAWQSEVELRNLRAELTPHLLFNCLAAVRGILRTDPERARDFIDRLSRFLRDSTNTQGRRTIALLDEWQLCEDFLGLQAMRYERDLPRLVDIDGPAYHAQLPPMIALNIVENAVKHGEIGQAHPLRVSAKLAGERLEISVRSHGRLGAMPSARPGGLGVSRARLRAIYGDDASLDIRQDGDDVLVTVDLPHEPPPDTNPDA